MIIGSIKENKAIEKRIAVTPDIINKYTSLGLEVYLSENYGSHIGINDEYYTKLGAKIFKDEIEVIKKSDVLRDVN